MKERIIGAVVLVVFVVLVVPIFLDGPPEESEVVSKPHLLPGQDEQTTKTVVLDRERSEPIPAASNPDSDVETEAPAQVVATPRPVVEPATPEDTEAEEQTAAEPVVAAPANEDDEEPVAAESPTPAASSTGMWAVQLGSFSNKENAERLADQLRRQGYAAFVSQVATASGTMHRVRIGPQKDRPSADAMASRLAKAGHQGRPVPHP